MGGWVYLNSLDVISMISWQNDNFVKVLKNVTLSLGQLILSLGELILSLGQLILSLGQLILSFDRGE